MAKSAYFSVLHRRQEKRTSGQLALTPSEFEQLMAHVDVLEDEVLIRLAVASGMRRIDIVHVEINNINFEERKIFFYEHKKNAIHSVYVSSELLLLISKYLNTLKMKRKYLFDFCDKTAYNRLQKYCEKAQMRSVPFHALRPTCIKFCKLLGWTMEETARHVNDSIRTIEQHYTTPSDAEMRERAEKNKVGVPHGLHEKA